jgi:hypothetical protein
MSVLDLDYRFASLSVRDLLDARDAYHFHLLSKANVIGTAIGLYLIRKDELWPEKKGEGRAPREKKTYARTLSNSEARDYSWPCILVFVRKWAAKEQFNGQEYDPAEIVPRTLYLADGRAVPVCVVEANEIPADDSDGVTKEVGLPAFKFGGGFPLIVEVQGVERSATAGCLVTDGHLTYALTARHACGEKGTNVYSRLRGGAQQIGTSSTKQLTRLPFTEVYPDFQGRRSFVSLDVGLVQLDNVDDWTSNTFLLPPVGAMADVHEHNLSLKLIDQVVIGHGASSGLLRGKIKGLFYRHRSIGGYDYVADFLIGPEGTVSTQHGDSGMVWHLDLTIEETGKPPLPLIQRDLRPLAVEWGGQVFDESGQRSTFAVATSLSNVCRLLDVELVTDLSRGISGYWGRTGHYTIGAMAIEQVGDPRLRDLLRKNAALISFDLNTIKQKDFDKTVGQLGDNFVPLADVPDEIWKKLDHGTKGREGGRDTSGSKTGTNGPEHPNHYADIDAPLGGNKTWRKKCLEDSSNITVARWLDFYATMAANAHAAGDPELETQYKSKLKQGLLPFRVWQFFDAMTGFASSHDIIGFVAAAGLLAHYVGDASQPLHGSIFADGDRSRTVTRHHPRTGEDETVIYAKGVHSAFETAMIAEKAGDLIAGINQHLPPGGHGLALCQNGKETARATLELMDNAATKLKPMDILDSFEQAGAKTTKSALDAMWQDLHKGTIDVMVFGVRYLAMIWESAWSAGNGDAVPNNLIKALRPQDLRHRYIDKTFVRSLTLHEIDPVLKK